MTAAMTGSRQRLRGRRPRSEPGLRPRPRARRPRRASWPLRGRRNWGWAEKYFLSFKIFSKLGVSSGRSSVINSTISSFFWGKKPPRNWRKSRRGRLPREGRWLTRDAACLKISTMLLRVSSCCHFHLILISFVYKWKLPETFLLIIYFTKEKLKAICAEYHKRAVGLESIKYDLEHEVVIKDYEVNQRESRAISS